jgi:hypothetical protein
MSKEPDCWIPGEAKNIYSRTLRIGTKLGFVVLLVTYALYVFGIMEAAVPANRVPEYWHLSAPEYMEAVSHEYLGLEHPPYGWKWVQFIGKADYLNEVGVCILGLVTIVCYLAILPKLILQRRRVYAVIALLEVIVLSLAASGIFTIGH